MATAPFSFLSRRRFLRVGLGGVALIAGGLGGLAGLRGCAPDTDGLRALSAHECRPLAHLARACLPAGGGIAKGADDFDLARAFDGFLADDPAANQHMSVDVCVIGSGPGGSTAARILAEAGRGLRSGRLHRQQLLPVRLAEH